MAKILIVGGVAGGASTAARLRRLDEGAEIILFERGEYISYANCGLPYYLGGTITDRDKLFVQTPQTFKDTLNIDVRVLNEVVAIDREQKKVHVKVISTSQLYWEDYDTLVLSPGAEPVRPPIAGVETPGIFTIRTVNDTDKIKTFVGTHSPKRAVIIGAGFIGLEMAENLHRLGIKVSIVEMSAQVMIMLDAEMAAEVHQHFKVKGIECYLGDGVKSIEPSETTIGLKLNSGRNLETDMVILSIGVRPDLSLASQAGLSIGPCKGILVNEYLQTSDPNIYALGDAIEFPSPITGKSTITYLAGPANKQGRLCADNIVGKKKTIYHGSIGTAVAKVFDLTVASTGVNEKTLRRDEIPFKSCIIHTSSHAGYYPGATTITLKLLFGLDHRILGAQAVGYEGVDKRIDMIAVLIGKQGSIEDLTEIEHAYAPPYSSAKDPVNVLGFIAQNLLSQKSHNLGYQELDLHPDAVLLDVRLAEEVALGAIPGSLNIPLQQLRQRLAEIPRDKEIIAICGVGLRAYLAERVLVQSGFKTVYTLSGGYKTWLHANDKQSNEDLFVKELIHNDDKIYQFDPDKSALMGGSMSLMITTIELDACGLQCPGPIFMLKKEMDKRIQGDLIKQVASDPGFAKDVESWCRMTGNKLLSLTQDSGKITALIEKGTSQTQTSVLSTGAQDTTLIVFSDDMDKALASLVIANGAASTGKKVTLFFTFWGLNVIKKVKKPKVKKGFMGTMFGLMLPSNLNKLSMSKLNMAGLGTWMMKGRMRGLKIDSLQTMLENAIASGVRMVACNMSMEVMGVKMEELLEGVESGGVATMLEAADSSRATFFI